MINIKNYKELKESYLAIRSLNSFMIPAPIIEGTIMNA